MRTNWIAAAVLTVLPICHAADVSKLLYPVSARRGGGAGDGALQRAGEAEREHREDDRGQRSGGAGLAVRAYAVERTALLRVDGDWCEFYVVAASEAKSRRSRLKGGCSQDWLPHLAAGGKQ